MSMPEENIDGVLEKAISMGVNCDEDTLEKLRQVPLLHLSRIMDSYLTSESYIIDALFLLSRSATKRQNLTDEEAVVVLSFLSSKLASLQTVEISVDCIGNIVEDLSSRRACSEIVFKELSNGFLPNVRLQALPIKIRRSGFKILKYMVSDSSLPWFTTSFLQLLLEAIDGEGEPELVMESFGLHHFISSFVDKRIITPLEEEYFDSLSSYFPVVFSQPQGCSVTRDDLRQALTQCMTSPLHVNLCISFILSRLASPSSVVKQESIAILLKLFSPLSEHIVDNLKPHIISVVSHIRNEIIKWESLGYNEGDSYPRDCMNLLSYIGKITHGDTPSTISSWLEPVTSGALSSLNSGRTICSAYATIFYHLVSSDISCCVALLDHFLPLLLMNLHGEVDSSNKENIILLLSGILTGIYDLCTTNTVSNELTSLQETIKKNLKLSSPELFKLIDNLCLTVDTLDGVSLKIITCELISCFLSLEAFLRSWMPVELVQLSYKSLISICLRGDEKINKKVSTCISRIGGVEGNVLNDVLFSDVFKKCMECSINNTNNNGLLTLFQALLRASISTALVAMELLLNPSHSLFAVRIPETDVFSLCRQALSEHADFPEHDLFHLVQLVIPMNSVAGFEFLCELLVRIRSGPFMDTVLQMIDRTQSWSILSVALLSSCDSYVQEVAGNLEYLTTELLNTVLVEETLRGVAMQGVSTICARIPNASESFLSKSKLLEPRVQLTIHAAIARGLLVTGLVITEEVETIMWKLIDAVCSDLVDIDDALIAIFFIPSSKINKHVTLLVPLIQTIRRDDRSIPEKLLKIILQLFENETLDSEFDWNSLLQVCERVMRSELISDSLVMTTVEFLDCIFSRIDSKMVFMKQLVTDDDSLFLVLLRAVGSSALHTRCTSLRLLSEVGQFAVQSTTMDSEDDCECIAFIKRIKEKVLNVTQVSLADPKRVVRRAAAQCRHQWYKLK